MSINSLDEAVKESALQMFAAADQILGWSVDCGSQWGSWRGSQWAGVVAAERGSYN